MSLEQEIHSQWAGDAALLALVPASRVFTGVAAGTVSLPYVVLNEHRSRPHVQVSGGTTVDRTDVAFQIYTDDLDEGKQVAVAVADQFDRSSFALSSGTVLSMRETESTEHIHDDGVWQVTSKYSAIIENS